MSLCCRWLERRQSALQEKLAEGWCGGSAKTLARTPVPCRTDKVCAISLGFTWEYQIDYWKFNFMSSLLTSYTIKTYTIELS